MTKKILIALVIVFIAVVALRFFTPEDTWLCQGGEWVKHGSPSVSKPTEICR